MYNNYPGGSQLSHFAQLLRDHGDRVVYQQEVGDNGTPHLQGYIEFKRKQRFTAITRIFSDHNAIHWEAAGGTRDENVDYCTKTGGTNTIFLGFPDKILLIHDLRPWQVYVVDLIKTQHALPLEDRDNRSIHWLWEEEGNVGKTALAKYIVATPTYNALYLAGKGADTLYALSKHFENDDRHRDNLVVLWNLSRAQENFGPYSTLEKIKDGLAFSSKYESCSLIFNTPIVFVFANWLPKLEGLSADRWNIKNIGIDI